MGNTDPLNGYYRSFEWVIPIFELVIPIPCTGSNRFSQQVILTTEHRPSNHSFVQSLFLLSKSISLSCSRLLPRSQRSPKWWWSRYPSDPRSCHHNPLVSIPITLTVRARVLVVSPSVQTGGCHAQDTDVSARSVTLSILMTDPPALSSGSGPSDVSCRTR